MNFKEIKAKLSELSSIDFIIELIGHSISESSDYIYVEDYDYEWEEIEENPKLAKHIKLIDNYKILDLGSLIKEHLGEYEVVHTSDFYDGYECFGVLYFKEHDIYVKVSGYYSSYNGTEWSTLREVKPKEKTIIVYENV